ncbi:MAG: S1/P1 nuclease [Chitinophagaceae bacterium]
MRSSIWKNLFLIGLCFYLPLQSMAWGMMGHRIVGQIAESYLSQKTKKEIQKILGNETLAMSSTWADFIKSDTSFKYLYNWHFIDFDENISFNKMLGILATDTAVDAYTKINFLAAELKNKNLSPDKKQMYLRLLVHIVGDVHQPMHVGRTATAGGNTVKLNWFNQPSNLHRLWDEQLIEYQQLSYTEYATAINFVTPDQKKQWQSQPISIWLFDSYQISEVLHNELKDSNPKLGYEYNFYHVNTLNEQLLKGGVHLAGLLNDIFGH